jgi:hypothetical protein
VFPTVGSLFIDIGDLESLFFYVISALKLINLI